MSITKYLIQRIETIDNVLDQPSIKNNMYLKNLCIDVIKQWATDKTFFMNNLLNNKYNDTSELLN